MICSYCGTELWEDGPYGFFAAHQSGKKLGDIYSCPVASGECESDTFNGLFYVPLSTGNLEEGYPC